CCGCVFCWLLVCCVCVCVCVCVCTPRRHPECAHRHEHQHVRGGLRTHCHILHAGGGPLLRGLHRRGPALLHLCGPGKKSVCVCVCVCLCVCVCVCVCVSVSL